MLHCSAHDIVFVAIWIIQKKKKKKNHTGERCGPKRGIKQTVVFFHVTTACAQYDALLCKAGISSVKISW